MKKLVCVLVMIGFSAAAVKAQDDGDKKVKMGIAITPSINWLTPGNDKKLTNNGSVVKMGIGLVADFRLTNVIWLSTGVEYTGGGGKIGYQANDSAFYYYKDDAIQSVSPSDASTWNSAANTDPKMKRYQLLSRTYKSGFLHIPVGFKMKTNELGGIVYYGQIGADIFIKTSSKGDDNVKDYTPSTTAPYNPSYAVSDISGNKLSTEVNFLNMAAHVGGGLEYRLSGSTAVFASIQYRHGFMNYTNADTYYLLRSTRANSTATPTITEFANATKQRSVVLTLGIMF